MLVAVLSIYTALQLIVIFKNFKTNKPIIAESFAGYLLVLAFLWIRDFFYIDIPNYAVILTILSIIGHSFFGRALNYYNTSRRYDRYLHAFGTFSFALFFYCLILSFINPAVNSRILTGVFTFTIGLSLGLVFEIVEFIIDCTRTKKTSTPRSQRGLRDTDLDMVFDIIGALGAA